MHKRCRFRVFVKIAVFAFFLQATGLPFANAAENGPEVQFLDDIRTSIPAYRGYAQFDVLAFQRDNGTLDRSLIDDRISGDSLLSTDNLNPSTAVGSRLFLGRRLDSGWGREVGYFGVYGMTAADSLSGDSNLFVSGPISSQILPFNDGEISRTTWVSTINSVEFNAFRSRCSGEDCFELLAGFRYLSVEEQAGISQTCCTTSPGGPYTSRYDVQTSNNLFGGQLGARGRYSWQNWALEGWGKAGIYGNAENQSQGPLIDPTGSGTLVRSARSATASETAFVGDINVSLIYRLTSVWGIRAGYNLVWIDGVALAPNQWDFSTNADAGTQVSGNSNILLSGANLGLEARW